MQWAGKRIPIAAMLAMAAMGQTGGRRPLARKMTKTPRRAPGGGKRARRVGKPGCGVSR